MNKRKKITDNEKIPLRLQKSKSYQQLVKMAKGSQDEESLSEHLYVPRKMNFDEQTKAVLNNILKKIINRLIPLLLVEVSVLLLFRTFDAIIGVSLGTIGAILGLIFIARSYEDYGIISIGTIRIPKVYGIRYFFYASLFLLSAILSKEPMWGIIGTFIGMINLKFVVYLFSWRW
ncbi:MAG: hypothetical protein ACP5JS_00560 [Fervidobacterium sp.]